MRIFDNIKIAIDREAGPDWDSPEFQEAVSVLTPAVPKIKAWLSAKTTIRKWNASGPNPSMGMEGNGAVARFSGQEPWGGRAWWDIEVRVVGDKVSVSAKPQANQYPGWGQRTVARAKVKDLMNPDSFLKYAASPLDLIFKVRDRY